MLDKTALKFITAFVSIIIFSFIVLSLIQFFNPSI